jgi:hypothetical protein
LERQPSVKTKDENANDREPEESTKLVNDYERNHENSEGDTPPEDASKRVLLAHFLAFRLALAFRFGFCGSGQPSGGRFFFKATFTASSHIPVIFIAWGVLPRLVFAIYTQPVHN